MNVLQTMEIALNFVQIQMEATSAHVNLITCLVLTTDCVCCS